MRCYYSLRDCKTCTKKRHCTVFMAIEDQKILITKLRKELEAAEMRLEPPDVKEMVHSR